jgi:diacylglycerol kinase (ATP)
VIANPAAGRAGHDSRAWRSTERALRQAGVEFDVEWTQSPGDGARIAATSWRAGRDRFLVAGGDGSLHDALNGLMRERCTDRTLAHDTPPRTPTLIPLPLGTGNDWARSLGLPTRPASLAAAIQRGRLTPHDAGRIDFLDATGATRDTCWFINVAGAGFDAHVIERMAGRTPSRFAYLYGALRELGRYRSPAFELTLLEGPGDRTGRRVDGRWLLAFVANGQYCGGGMHVAPTARQDDGLFDVVTIEALGLLRALPKLARLYSGSILRDRAVQLRVAPRLRIDALPQAGLEADGQFVGRTPAVITIEPDALHTLRGP